MTGRLDPGTSLMGFGFAVEAWHRHNWPEVDHEAHRAANRILGVTKVAEEAGELVGALTRVIEGRPDLGYEEAIDNTYAELADVVIAAAGALRRLNDLTGQDRAFGDVVLDRWADVSLRDYRR